MGTLLKSGLKMAFLSKDFGVSEAEVNWKVNC